MQPSESIPRRNFEILALAITALGFALRAHSFTEPWLSPDEGIYFWLALAPSWGDFSDGVAANAHPPLQYLIVRGLTVFSANFSWLRAPSLIAGSLAVYVMIRLGREAVGWRTGLIAGLLLAASPGSIVLSQVMRPYALLLLCLTASAFFALRYLRRRSANDLLLHTISLGLAMTTHYAAFVTAPAFAGLLLGEALLARRPRREVALRLLAQIPLAGLAAAAWFLHLQPHVLGGAVQRGAQDGWLEPYMHDSALDAWLGFVGVQRYLLGVDLEAVAIAAFLIGWLALVLSRRYSLALLSAGVLVVAAAAALLDQLPFGGTRHSSYLAAFILPVIAAPLGLAWDRGIGPASAVLGVAMASLLWPAPLRMLTGADRLTTPTPSESVASADSIRDRVAEIEQAAREPRLIVMDRQTFRFLAPYLHRLSAPSRHGRGVVLAGFRWGEADVIVSRAWTLRVDRRAAMGAGHLRQFLSSAARALPKLDIDNRTDGLFVVGGWNVDRYEQLLETDQALSHGREGAVRNWKHTPGLATASVDWARYRALLLPRERPPESTD